VRLIVNRLLALVLNTLLPGTGLLLRRSGWGPTIPACLGVAGWTLLGITLVSAGNASTIFLGWVGLGIYALAATLAGLMWLSEEQPSSSDLTVIQPLFQEFAGHYLRHDLPAAEHVARRLVRLAASEPGAWRLFGLILRARGSVQRAQRAEQRAERLAQVRD
jgi:hypothetical protein